MSTDAAPPGPPQEPAERWIDRHRRAVVITLVVLGAVIALVSTLTVWVRNQALDQEAWTDASSQLLANDDVRQQLSLYLANELFQNVNVSGELSKALPERLQPLAVPLAASLQSSAPRIIDTALQRPRVQALWRQANAAAHDQLAAVINGDDNALLVQSGGDVVLDLRPLTKQLRSELGLPPPRFERPRLANITVMSAEQLDNVRTSVRLVKGLSILLWLVVIALWGAALWLAHGFRARTIMWMGLSLVLVGLLVLALRRIGGDVVVNALAGNSTSDSAVFAAWSIGTELARDQAWGLISYGLLFALGAWLVGASRWATWLRTKLRPVLSAGPGMVMGGAAVLGIVLLLILPVGDGRRLIGYVVLLALMLAGVWALRRFVIDEASREGTPPPAGPAA